MGASSGALALHVRRAGCPNAHLLHLLWWRGGSPNNQLKRCGVGRRSAGGQVSMWLAPLVEDVLKRIRRTTSAALSPTLLAPASAADRPVPRVYVRSSRMRTVRCWRRSVLLIASCMRWVGLSTLLRANPPSSLDVMWHERMGWHLGKPSVKQCWTKSACRNKRR